jgi:DNA-binding transcriptional regulator YiaG
MRYAHSRVAFSALDKLIDHTHIMSMRQETNMTKTELLAKREAYVKHLAEWEVKTGLTARLTIAFSRDMIKTIDTQLAAL